MKRNKYRRGEVEEYGPEHDRGRLSGIAKYERLIRELTELLLYLRRQENRARSASAGRSQTGQGRERVTFLASNSASSQPLKLMAQHNARDDLSDLPPELLKELSEEATRKMTHPLIEIIDGRGGTAALDEILIDLYRKYKKLGRRASVAQRLLVLSRRGLCRLVPGASGYYTTANPDGCEVKDKKEPPLEVSKATP